jgi:glycosyltransferase involved in cell wall biosynthesis
MSVIPNGVDLQRFHSADPIGEKKSARAMLGTSATAEVVVFVGSIIHRKGVDVLLRAFARVAASNPLAELVLVGPREDSVSDEARTYGTRLDELVRRSGAGGRIHFAGYVENVATYLRAADVFVLPSRREGMGNVVLEAMAMGIPTVLTPYLGLPGEFGEPGTQYVLSGPDVDSLASHIESLLKDRDRRRTIGEEGRRWVEEHMGMSIAIDAYARIYRDLAVHGTVRPRNRVVSWIE